MPTTHQRVSTAREFFDEIVTPDFHDFLADTASLRKAFHCALSLYHLHEWVFADHGSQLGDASARDFDRRLCSQSTDFQLIRDIANAAKHMVLNRDPQRLTHSANVEIQSTAFGEGAYGQGPYGGGKRARAHVGPTTYEELDAVARDVFNMWTQMFQTNGW
jgi:hypothetical protein